MIESGAKKKEKKITLLACNVQRTFSDKKCRAVCSFYYLLSGGDARKLLKPQLSYQATRNVCLVVLNIT